MRLFDRQPLMSRSKSRLAVILYRRCKFALFVFDIQYDLDGSPLETFRWAVSNDYVMRIN